MLRSPCSVLAALAVLASGVLVAVACRTPEPASTVKAEEPEGPVTMPDMPGGAAAATPVAASSNDRRALSAFIILN